MYLGPSPLLEGFRPCGACQAYVDKCEHWKPGMAAYRRPERPARPPRFRCPACRKESSNPKDLEEGYCGRCCAFTGKPQRPSV